MGEQERRDTVFGERDAVVPKVHARLRELLWLRFHIGVLVCVTIFAGSVTSVVLQRVGFFRSSLGARYAVACLTAYVCFLFAVRMWVKYIAGIRPRLGAEMLDRGRFDPSRMRRSVFPAERRKKSDGLGDGCDGCSDPGCLDLEAVGIFLVVVGLAFAVSWIFTTGPLILAEIAADTLLAGGLLKWARRTEFAWMESAFRATCVPFAIALVILAAFGAYADVRCPEATRLGEVWACLKP